MTTACTGTSKAEFTGGSERSGPDHADHIGQHAWGALPLPTGEPTERVIAVPTGHRD